MIGENRTAGPEFVARLERSRGALLVALTERTEADFACALGGDYGEATLGQALATLAQAERADLAAARSEVVPQREPPEKPSPPQVTHDLAGARHQTLSHLGSLDAPSAEALVDAIEARESDLVMQIGTMLSTPAEPATDAAEPSERTRKPPLQFPVLD